MYYKMAMKLTTVNSLLQSEFALKTGKDPSEFQIYPSLFFFCCLLYFAQVCLKSRQSRSSVSSREDDGGMKVMIRMTTIAIITITADIMTPIPQRLAVQLCKRLCVYKEN